MHDIKLSPPTILDAPDDLAALVVGYATATTTAGRLEGFYAVLRWFRGKRAHRTVFVAGDYVVRCWGGDVHLGERFKPLKAKESR